MFQLERSVQAVDHPHFFGRSDQEMVSLPFDHDEKLLSNSVNLILFHLCHCSAQKSLFGGVEDVQACNEAEPVGFTPACAEWYVSPTMTNERLVKPFLQYLRSIHHAYFFLLCSWTVDELCAKKNCFWIFLQSTMINAVSDYRVQINDITSATCK